MNLFEMYKGMPLSTYPDYEFKQRYGRKGVKFIKEACKLAGVTSIKKYPYHNKGGGAVMGEVYGKIQHPTKNRVLEICLCEMAPYYRTNGEGGYGTNIFPCGMGINTEKLEKFTEVELSEIIKKFIEGNGF